MKKILILFLILEVFYIGGVLLNYDNAWINPETLDRHKWFLNNGPAVKLEDFKRGLDVLVIENGVPRLSRPFSGLFDMLNIKFRAWAWNFIPPHPTLALSWPLFFIFIPILLFRFFKNMGCSSELSLGGVILYLATIGFLGPIVMDLRSGKSFVNFFAILSLAVASGIQRRIWENKSSKERTDIKPYLKDYILLLSILFFSFFWDETGIFIAVLIAIFCKDIFWKVKQRWWVMGAYLFLGVSYFVVLLKVLPFGYSLIFERALSVTDYNLFPTIQDLVWPNLTHYQINMQWQFRDHLNTNLFYFKQDMPWGVFWFAVLNWLALCAFCVSLCAATGHFIFVALKRRKLGVLPYGLIACCILVPVFIYFLTFQLSHHYKVWGAFWYANLFSLIYVSLLVFSLLFISQHVKFQIAKALVVLLVFIFTSNMLIASTYRNNVAKIENMTRTISPHEIFRGKFNTYQYFDYGKSFRNNRIKFLYTMKLWHEKKQKPFVASLARKYDALSQEEIESCEFLDNHKQYLAAELF